MVNKLLFGIIGILLLVIAGVGIFARTSIQATLGATPAPTQNTTPGIIDAIATTSEISTSTVPSPVPTSPTYSMVEVSKHASTASCYTVVNGSVYDLTPFISKHPGGVPAISRICGKDGTDMFTGKHGGQARPEQELASLKIGTLAR